MKSKKNTELWKLQNREMKEGICLRCSKYRELTVEHIIPAHLLEQLGLFDEMVNDVENFELLCYTCNKFKAGRLDLTHKKTVYLLRKYIDKLEQDDGTVVV